MERLGVFGRVCVEDVAVVQDAVGLPRLLVPGEVPASSKFGLQSLRRTRKEKMMLSVDGSLLSGPVERVRD